MKKRYCAIILFLLLQIPARSQNGMSGTEFWIGFLENMYSNPSTNLNIVSNLKTTVNVSIPQQFWDTTFIVNANSHFTLNLNSFMVQNTISEMNMNRGVYVHSEKPVSVFASNHSGYSSDATHILPLSMLKTKYHTIAYNNSWSQSNFVIVATENNSQIQITPSFQTQMGKPVGVPFTINLHKGQTYMVKSDWGGDLTGTTIEGIGDCPPFAVFSGAVTVAIPQGVGCCVDHLFQQMPPEDQLGTQYLVSPVMGTFAIRILAVEDGTIVSVNGGAGISLNKGRYHTIYNLSSPQFINSNQPVLIAQYLQSQSGGGAGDPAMTILFPLEKIMFHADFSTSFHSYVDKHYVSIFTRGPVTNMLLNGTDISVGFLQFPEAPEYYYKIVSITHGKHTLSCERGFFATVFGIGYIDSYLYSLGGDCSLSDFYADFTFSEPLCENQSVNFSSLGFGSFFSWDFGHGNTATGRKVSNVFSAPGTYEITMVADYCSNKDTVTKTIEISDFPTINFSDNTLICGQEPIELYAYTDAEHLLWSTGDTVLSIITDRPGIYSLTAGNKGCSTTKTVQVSQLAFPEVNIEEKQKQICFGEEYYLKAEVSAHHQNIIWSTSEKTSAITIKEEGHYWIEASNDCGSVRDSFFLKVNPVPGLEVSNDTTILLGTSTRLFALGGHEYTWFPAFGLSCIDCSNPHAKPEKNTSYLVSAKNEFGCHAQKQINVFVDENLNVYIPNIFSPNNDGQNDILFVRGKGIKEFQFSIFNRWGEKVFETYDLNYGWDGNFKGEPASQGIYIYMLQAHLESGQTITKKGDITLLR
jgi:gliding motility-associated-like protein